MRLRLQTCACASVAVASLLQACGSETGSADRSSASHAVLPSFVLVASGVPLVAVDAHGLRVKDAALVGPSAPALSFEGFGFAGEDARSLSALPGWRPVNDLALAPAFRAYDPISGYACDVRLELARLAALGSGATARIAPPNLPAPTGASCAAVSALRCYLAAWDEPIAEGGDTLARVYAKTIARNGTLDSATLYALAQAAQKAILCGATAGGSGVKGAGGDTRTAAGSFAVSANSLLFSPSPVVSISIYNGSLSDYDEALVNRTPVATVAVPETCAEADRACVTSPLPIVRCPKCVTLVRGRTYTAFLPERPGQRHSAVKAVRFVR